MWCEVIARLERSSGNTKCQILERISLGIALNDMLEDLSGVSPDVMISTRSQRCRQWKIDV